MSEVDAVIRLRHGRGRLTLWNGVCSECGDLPSSSTKTGATKLVVTHAETVHGRNVQIRVPVRD